MLLENIEFKNYQKRSDIHGTALYPAVMVAPVQKDILSKLVVTNDISSVFDPFHGSGTSLYEAWEVSPDLRLIGCDINPLANLITQVKLTGVSPEIYSDIEVLKKYIEAPVEAQTFSFYNIDKWFKADIIESLTLIRSAIMKINNKRNRLFFWYMLCDIVRRFSNTRSSTYKLHVKKKDVVERIENNVIGHYLLSLEKNVAKFIKLSETKFDLYKCDTLLKIKEFSDREFDVSITSPPYGDNATTVPYGQFSMLALHTIDKKDLIFEGWELENYSKIDSQSLGGNKTSEALLGTDELDLIKPYLDKIETRKQKKVVKFFGEYFFFIKELCRVTNKYIVLTLGNRTVDRIQIDLTKISEIYLEANNFKNVKAAQREIPKKRIPNVTSNVHDRPVNSMNKEFILIHERTVT